MSYASAAAKGGPQPPEEARAPAPPEIVKTESVSTASLVDVDAPSVQSVHSDFLNQEVKTTTQAERLEREAEEALARSKASASKKGKAKAKSIRDNAENPVYIGNAVIIAAVSAGLGYGAYRKHTEGRLSWEVAGIWAGAVGLFAGVDYFVSKWLIQNKYPKKD
ncbi:hypothetical protein BGW36DRAFT_368466 [Talaromyces proteolyticus]|uniref:Mitochondrial outer membrane protein OM14 C-terminal domain-containing protein n=1 Tax=Talaromyces proteolyticus TaxID=1131652 RepID=A0AAD4L4X2_9EURO|nr:uncharacterized protein BGW36DRAFT_368466 [Talaromyces proteolyticus]KAH8705953.1 hypothetical protein BGW36DRAFT_368466 [Talaromyces proteolyticus]